MHAARVVRRLLAPMPVLVALLVVRTLFGDPAPAAAATSYTGFIVSSETGNPVGGGAAHDHMPSTLTATGAPNDITIAGHGWEFRFSGSALMSPGDRVDGTMQFQLRKDGGAFCTSADWTVRIHEAPVVVAGVVTRFAADFWRDRCSSSAPTAAIFGTIRIGSPVLPELLHITGALTFPDTYVGEESPPQTIEVRNVGDTDVTIEPASIAGSHPTSFTLVDGCGPVTLDPGQSCTLTATFEPETTTTRTAVVSIPSSAYGPTRTADLSGYGLSPLLKIPSALVIDGQPGALTDGDHFLDPVEMSALGDAARVDLEAADWDVRIWNTHGVPLAVGTYEDVALTSSGPSLRVARDGRVCSEPYEASFTVLEAPVVDTDGTILSFAADFSYACPETSGRTVRGWVRLHSDADRPGPSPLSYRIDVDTGTSAHVGETVTFTPQVTGTDFLDGARCVMALDTPESGLRWMVVGSDGCEPWTFTIPPSPVGDYVVSGYLITRNGSAESFLHADDRPLAITSGTSVPFTSNYPVASWATSDLLSDPTPAFGVPLTVRPPDGLDACRLSVFGGMESVVTYQDGTCADWVVTLRAPTPDAVGSFYGDRADVMVRGWVGESTWSNQDPELPHIGARYGATYNSSIPSFTGTGGAYASSLPAIFADAARGNVYYTTDSTTHSFAPVVVGATSGSCASDRAPFTRPLVAGACGTFDVPPTEFAGNVGEGIRFQLRDVDGNVVAETSTDIGFIDPLPPVAVTVPALVATGSAIPVNASTPGGVPASYVVSATAVGASTADPGTSAAAANPSITGQFDVAGGETGASIAVSLPALPAGTWDIRTTFTDVLGASRSTTKRIDVVLDTVAPTVTAPVAGIVPGSTISDDKVKVRVRWSGSDATSGIARYELAQSVDGGPWTSLGQQLSGTSRDLWLSTQHTYRFEVRAWDRAGNRSSFRVGPESRLSRYAETTAAATYAGTWSTQTGASLWGGSAKRSSSSAASVRVTLTGRHLAWVSAVGPDQGKAEIWLGSTRLATVDLYSPTPGPRRIVWVGGWTTSASRTFTIRVLGTPGRPRVLVDGFLRLT